MKKSMRGFSVIICSLVVLVAGTSVTLADPLFPASFLTPVPDELDPFGGILVDELAVPFVGADIEGTLISKVVDGDLSNPFGGLTFIYQVISDAASAAPVEALTVGNWGPFDTDVSFNPMPPPPPIGEALPPGVPPTYVSRNVFGEVISFSFSVLGGIGILPGENSEMLVVQTDASTYDETIASVINAGSAEVLSFAPLAVPEPATLAIFGLGVLALLATRRR